MKQRISQPGVDIIYLDDDILVVNKPSGVSVTKDRSGKAQLVDILSNQLGEQLSGQLRLVHRLDKDASGVLVLARNKNAQRLLTEYFNKRLVRKIYLAIVSWRPGRQEGEIELPLARDRRDSRFVRVDYKKGKEAVTKWQLLADFGPLALLVVEPLTGRTHQIRVHLAASGMPLAIDPLYGGTEPLFLSDFKTDYRLGKGKSEKPLIQRLTLHAYQLSFPVETSQWHRPSAAESNGKAVDLFGKCSDCPRCFVARLDRKFAATIKMLAKHSRPDTTETIRRDWFSAIINAQPLE